MPNAINKIVDNPQVDRTVTPGEPEFEVIIKKNGEVLYHNKGYAIVGNVVQSPIKYTSKDQMLDADSQTFAGGNALSQWYALDQLKKKMEDKIREMMGIEMSHTGDTDSLIKKMRNFYKSKN